MGRLVVEKLLKKASEMRAAEINVHAQTHARGFYEKSGFITHGETFLEANTEHISWQKDLRFEQLEDI